MKTNWRRLVPCGSVLIQPVKEKVRESCEADCAECPCLLGGIRQDNRLDPF